MAEEDKEYLREQLITFNSQQEVCDMLGISTPELLEAFEHKLLMYVHDGGSGEE